MRHRAKGRQLSRTATHKKALLRNMAASLFKHDAIVTTEAKAKEVRGMVDHLIVVAKRGDLPARRQLVAQLPNEPLIIEKLMGELAAKYAERRSGFTRITRLGPRPGDSAPMVQIELV